MVKMLKTVASRVDTAEAPMQISSLHFKVPTILGHKAISRLSCYKMHAVLSLRLLLGFTYSKWCKCIMLPRATLDRQLETVWARCTFVIVHLVIVSPFCFMCIGCPSHICEKGKKKHASVVWPSMQRRSVSLVHTQPQTDLCFCAEHECS